MAYDVKQGQIVYLDLNNKAGREQMGQRPAIVISKLDYNQYSSVIQVIPVSNTSSAWPFYIPLAENDPVKGKALVDQITTVDPQARNINPSSKYLTDKTLQLICERLIQLLCHPSQDSA